MHSERITRPPTKPQGIQVPRLPRLVAFVLAIAPVPWLGMAHAQDSAGDPVESVAVVDSSPANCVWDELPLEFVDPFGKATQLPVVDEGVCRVALLVSTECPLARLYMERCQTLARSPNLDRVSWSVVSVVPQDGPTDLQRFQSDLSIEWPLVKENSGVLVERLAVERVPTAVVIAPDGHVIYVGRVDNQYEVGQRRSEPTRFELREAIEACLAGTRPEIVRSAAPGCLIPRRRELQDSPTVTYSSHIAAILDRRCNSCHRPNDIGPMSFVDAAETSGWGDMILEVIDDGRMPPWNAVDPVGTFANENRLTEEERELIAAWVEQGSPLGDPAERPTLPTYADSWRLPSEPDLVIELPRGGFRVPASGTVDYQYFVVDPQWTEDRWIRAAQLLPGAPSVVHHAIAFTRSPETTRFDGLGILAGFVPGQEPTVYRPGMARRIPAGSKIVFQMHYTPSGTEEVDCSRLGLWFADEAQVEWEVLTGMIVESAFEIPAQASRYEVSIEQSGFPRGTQLLSLAPHMHFRGAAVEVDWREADEESRLLSVPHYDFNWQHTYKLTEPRELSPDGTLVARLTFDNSSANIANPDPDRSIRWGEQTWEEMAVVFLDIALPRTESQGRVAASPDSETASLRKELATFVQRFDVNRDGFVDRKEVPEALGAFAFDRLDRNEDDRIDLADAEEPEETTSERRATGSGEDRR